MAHATSTATSMKQYRLIGPRERDTNAVALGHIPCEYCHDFANGDGAIEPGSRCYVSRGGRVFHSKEHFDLWCEG